METNELTNNQLEILKIIYKDLEIREEREELPYVSISEGEIKRRLLKIDNVNKFKIISNIDVLLAYLVSNNYIGCMEEHIIDSKNGITVFVLKEKGYNKLKEVS